MLGTAGAISAKAMIGELIVKLFTSPIKEILQELVADSLTEAFVQFAVEELGGTEDLGFWLSSLATSLRESTAGPLANIAFSTIMSGTKSSTSLQKASGRLSMLKGLMTGNQDLAKQGYVTFEEAIAQEEKSQLQKKTSQSGWRKLLSSGVLKGIALASASLITGGMSFFTLMGMAQSLDSSVEHFLAPSTQELAIRHLCRTNQIMAMKQELNLFLHKNQLNYIPESIGNLTKLKDLSLEWNQLNYIPESIGNLKSLKILKLTDNQLKELPDTIGNLESLEYLSLSINNLTMLPDTLKNLKNLEEIWITGNPLLEFPNALNDLNKLKYIKIGSKLNQKFESEFQELRERGVQEY